MLQGSGASLLPVVTSAADARVMLEALEAGTDGAVLRTDSPAEARPFSQLQQQTQWAVVSALDA